MGGSFDFEYHAPGASDDALVASRVTCNIFCGDAWGYSTQHLDRPRERDAALCALIFTAYTHTPPHHPPCDATIGRMMHLTMNLVWRITPHDTHSHAWHSKTKAETQHQNQSPAGGRVERVYGVKSGEWGAGSSAELRCAIIRGSNRDHDHPLTHTRLWSLRTAAIMFATYNTQVLSHVHEKNLGDTLSFHFESFHRPISRR